MLTLVRKEGSIIKCDAVVSVFTHSCKARLWLLALLMAAALKGRTQAMDMTDSIADITGNGYVNDTMKQINLSAFHFVKPPGNRINFGLVGNEYHYILLKLNAAHTYAGQYLSIDNTSLDTLNIYRLFNDGTSRLLYRGGSLVAYDNNRNYVWHTVPVALSTTPSFYLVALKAAQKNINVAYEILDEDDLQKKYQGYERIIFFYLGVVFIISTIIILAFFLFRKVEFAAYLGYIICISGWIFSHYGRVFPFLYPNHPLINEVAKPVSSLGACFFLMVVLLSVFKQQLQSGLWLKRFIQLMMYILPALMGCMLLLLISGLHAYVRFALMAGWQIGLILSFYIIVLVPIYHIRSGSTAKIFSAAMLMVGIMALVQLIATLGYFNNFFINEHGMAIASLLEIAIMAFGLFNSLLEEKKQKEMHVLALEQEQTDTLKKLITVQDKERKRIAGDLHDNIGPLLAALKINFRRIVHAKEGDLRDVLITKTESIIDDSIVEIRNVAHNLMPKGLSSNGLINTLTGYLESMQQLYNKPIVFQHQIESVLHPDVQINLYRIICELVLNAARHSNARLITVHIKADGKCASISIQDDGIGFAQKPDNKESLGLQNAESRVLYMKGTFYLNTIPGKGTVIDMQIPL